MKRIETLSKPAAKEARQPHSGRTAFGTARAPTDIARAAQRTNTAFGQIVVRGYAWVGHENKEFGQKAFNPFTQGPHGGPCVDKRRTQLPQLLLEGVLERHPLCILLGRGQLCIRSGGSSGAFIDLFDMLGPLLHLPIVRMLLLELVDIAQEMHPTALMQALMDVVARVKVAAQHARELLADQAFDHFPCPRVMIFVVSALWGADAPDVAILAIFSPARFIGLHRGAGSDVRFDLIEGGLG